MKNWTALRILDISSNKIESLEHYLAELPKKTLIIFEGNLLKGQQSQWISEDIRNFFSVDHALRKRTRIMLVGSGMVGKTSLYLNLEHEALNKDNRLGGPDLPNKDNRTIGIDVFDIKPDQDREWHIWDFAGQEVYRPYNQQYFTDGVINILLWKVNHLITEGDAVVWQDIRIWLHAISEVKSANQKIVVLVGNIFSTEDNFPNTLKWLEIPLSNLYDKVSQLCEILNIQLIYKTEVNCKTGERISELFQILKSQSSLMDEKISEDILDLEKKLPLDPVLMTATDFHLKHFTSDRVEFALSTLHRIGTLLYSKQNNTVILNPRKLPKIVGQIVRAMELQQHPEVTHSPRKETILGLLAKYAKIEGQFSDDSGKTEELYRVLLQQGFFIEDSDTQKIKFPYCVSAEPASITLPQGSVKG
jgi:GTPase SAR1 family protein